MVKRWNHGVNTTALYKVWANSNFQNALMSLGAAQTLVDSGFPEDWIKILDSKISVMILPPLNQNFWQAPTKMVLRTSPFLKKPAIFCFADFSLRFCWLA